MKASLTSIAKVAGVSATTVHDALYDCGRVHPETRAKIKAMAQQLGYRPNRMAQTLRRQRSGLLGVVLSNLFMPLSGRMLPVIEEIARTHGYHIFYACSHDSEQQEREVMDLLLGNGMEGLLLFPAEPCNALPYYRSIRQELPLVMIDPSHDCGSDFDVIGTDNAAGGVAAATALLQAGRRHLAFYLPCEKHAKDWWVQGRLDGCAGAVGDAGLRLSVLASPAAAPEVLSHYHGRSLPEYLSSGGRLDGIVAANDTLAYQAISELHQYGLEVPADVAVVGFDDASSSVTFSPPLASLRQPMERIGKAAIELLLRRLARDTSPVEHQQYPPELIVRASIAAPAAPAPPPRRRHQEIPDEPSETIPTKGE